MAEPRWTDALLDEMRDLGDPVAEQCYTALQQDGEINEVDVVFKKMNTNDEKPVAALFPAFASFFNLTDDLPEGTDLARIQRAEATFQKHAVEMALALLTKSLPEGYAAPNLAIVLNMSGDLRTHTYKRLMSTLQMVVNVTTIGGFQPGGRAIVTAQKLRLLHAGVRALTRKYRPTFEAQYHAPANKEDMLGTIIGLSLLVIEGMRTLNVGLTPQEEEDCFYLWRIFAMMMAIHPTGQPNDYRYVPDSVADAQAFYAAYKRRHYVLAPQNPDGVSLARANKRMLVDLIPKFLRLLGLGVLPRLYMTELMGHDMCRRIGIRPVFGLPIMKWILTHIHALFNGLESKEKQGDKRFAMILFQDLINRADGGEVTFTVPQTMQDLLNMA